SVQLPVLDADNAHSKGHKGMVATDIDFVSVAVIYVDVLQWHSGGLQSRHNFADDLWRRATGRSSGWVEFDPDDILGFDKFAPCLPDILNPGQFLQRAMEHGPDNRLRNAIVHNGLRVRDFNDAARKEPGHSQRRTLNCRRFINMYGGSRRD